MEAGAGGGAGARPVPADAAMATPSYPGDPACNDGQENNLETDVDCGGPVCRPCDVHRSCTSSADCLTGSCDGSLCVLASGPPFWLPGVPMKSARGGHGAATQFFGNHRGNLVVVGGFLQSELDTYEVFDPESSSWTSGKLPAAPCCRLPAASGPDGKVYLVYGDQHATWVYDGSWNPSLAPPPDGCVHAGLALGADKLLYVLCSHDSQLAPNPLMTYDTALDRWATLKPTPTATTNVPWMTSLGSRIYVLSTEDGNQYPFEAFDIDSGTWSALATPSLPSLIVGAPDGRVYKIAGFGPQGAIYAPTAAVSAYDPTTDRWTPVAPLTLNRYDHAVTAGPDGRLYAIGGVNNGSVYTNSVEVYGPVVSLASSTAAPGGNLTLTGHNFAAQAKVSIHLGATADTLLGTGRTNADGALDSAIVFRAGVTPGDYVMTVIDDKSRFPVTIPFTVK